MKKIILLLVLIFLSELAFCQKENSLENSTLSTYLTALELKYDVSFSYNPTFFKNSNLKEKPTCLSLNECIHFLENEFSIKFEMSGVGNYLVVPVRKKIKFKVLDADENLPIYQIYAGVNNQEKRYFFPKNDLFVIGKVHSNDSIHIETLHYRKKSFLASDLIKNDGIVSLQQNSINLKKVLIKGYLTKGIDAKLEDHSFQIEMKDLGLLAGETDGDIFSIVKNIPGISTPDGKPGNYNFRGSPFAHNSTRIDDIPMYYKGHFFGTISPYNPIEVENIQIYRNSLPSEYGGKVGG